MNKYTEEALIQTICRMAMELTEAKQAIEDALGQVDSHRQRAFKFAEEGLRAEARVAELELQLELNLPTGKEFILSE